MCGIGGLVRYDAPVDRGVLDAMRALKRDGYHSVFLMLTDVNPRAEQMMGRPAAALCFTRVNHLLTTTT